jgi:hypothetical protein
MTADVAMEAFRMGMDLIPVLPGITGGCQPMRVRVFGVVQRNQSRRYDDAMRACAGKAWTKGDAVRMFIEAWAEIGPRLSRKVRQR